VRILVTLPYPERLGGSEALLQTIIDGVPGSGHEMELVFTHDGSWPAELAASGFRVEVLEAGRVRELHRWLATVVRLARIFHRRKPDVILNWAAKSQIYAAPAAMLVGMSDRVVWWQHTIAEDHWLDRLASRLPARAIGCCSQAAARAQRRMAPAREIFVVAAGAAPPSQDEPPAPIELPDDVPIVGLVGRLQPWKGQDRMLEAQALLRDRGRRMHSLIVGGDSYELSPEYAASLGGLVRSLGLERDVTMTGEVPDAMPYVKRMDVLVNASDPEPFGIVLLEGMAAGLPVVAVDSGGPAEIVLDGQTGALARTGEPGDLADALERVLGAPELGAALGRAGRERFDREYSDVALRKRFFKAFEELLDGNGRGDVGGR
jgi:glycosyltransferase involved in cell wall biosynthesis